ncbi:MAG: hypothetical protein COA94_04430 [Rickettsiales bacterium]|nr:MAG: hypothetical protein COA94_04430 [Rickettsiales bacterium]
MKQRITKLGTLGTQYFRSFTGSNLRFKAAGFSVTPYSGVNSRDSSNSINNWGHTTQWKEFHTDSQILSGKTDPFSNQKTNSSSLATQQPAIDQTPKKPAADLSTVPDAQEQGRSNGGGGEPYNWEPWLGLTALALGIFNVWQALKNRAESREYEEKLSKEKAREQLKSDLKELSKKCSNNTIEDWPLSIENLLDFIKKNYSLDPSTLAKLLSDYDVDRLAYIIASYCNSGHPDRVEAREKLEFARKLIASKCNCTLDEVKVPDLFRHHCFSELYIELTGMLSKTYIYPDNTESDIKHSIFYVKKAYSLAQQHYKMTNEPKFWDKLLSEQNFQLLTIHGDQFVDNPTFLAGDDAVPNDS